jgi:exodeoxyribonuclease V alpha subunit
MMTSEHDERRQRWCEALDVDPALVALAKELPALMPSATPDATREGWTDLILLFLRAESEGSTRLELGDALRARLNEEPEDGVGLQAPGEEISDFAARLTKLIDEPHAEALLAPETSPTSDPRPLRIEHEGLTSRRSALAEESLAALLLDSSSRPASLAEADKALLERASHLARTGEPPLGPGQEAALDRVLRGRLGVITGGPGTGKTTLVVRLVETLIRHGLHAESLRLAAPTGRAAARLHEALRQGVGDRQDEVAREMRALEPLTIHRLLGFQPQRARFRHGKKNPLPLEALIIDEASMLDIDLTGRILDALPPGARLIFVGDADQLPSVGRGAVLRDLVLSDREDARVARLDRSYRVDRERDAQTEALAILADQVRAGDVSAVAPQMITGVPEALPRGPWMAELTARRELLEAWYALGFADLGELSPPALLQRHRQRRVYAFTRILGRGRDALDALLHELHARSLGRSPREAWLPGEPVLVTRNDPSRGLANGDLGVIAAEGSRLLVHLEGVGPQGQGERHELGTIEANLERAWASTIHKAQGSECDEALIVLPDRDGPFLNREALYTAITRCRRGCLLSGSRLHLQMAIQRRQQRATGLAKRIQAR